MSSVTVTGDIAPTSVVDEALSDVDAGLHPGIQVYASRFGEPIADFGVGYALPGVPMVPSTPVPWLSATKPLLALAIGQLVHRGRLSFDDRVADVVAEFAAEDKHDVRFSHLLTHTVPFVHDISMSSLYSWESAVAEACALPLRKSVPVGNAVRYTAFASWQVLGETVQRLTGTPVAEHIRRTIMEPLGMGGSKLSGDSGAADGGRGDPARSQLLDRRRAGSGLFELGYAALPHDVAIPGVCGSGPVRELGLLYEALAIGGDGLERIGLSEEIADEMTRTHRPRLHDPFYGGPVEWGLGFVTDRRVFAGTRISRRSFGHDGRLCAIAFADPDAGVVVCVMANALVDARANSRRLRRVIDPILEIAGVHGGRR